MAPRREMLEKFSTEQGTTMIVDYLKKQNRPYSATDISANLHNKVTNSYAKKALKELHESQVIAGKAAGKQVVYHAIQEPADPLSLEDLAALDKEIAGLRDSIATAKANEKLLQANLISVNATPSTEELRSDISLLELEKKEIVERLEKLRSGNVKPVSPEEKEAVDKEWGQWSRKAGRRKKICMELWGLCTQELPEGKTRGELWVGVALVIQQHMITDGLTLSDKKKASKEANTEQEEREIDLGRQAVGKYLATRQIRGSRTPRTLGSALGPEVSLSDK
ncbi:hypothetical protein ACLMJK_000307 [Lecanora helva]